MPWEALLKLVGICTTQTFVSCFSLKKRNHNPQLIILLEKVKLLCIYQIHKNHKIHLLLVVQMLKKIHNVEMKLASGT